MKIEKPRCKLSGEDGNIFNLIGAARRTLKKAGMPEKADEMSDAVMKTHSYSDALAKIGEYVEIE